MESDNIESGEISSQKIRKKRSLPKSVRPEEFKKLISKIPKKDYIARIAFLLAYGSGMRVSEVLKLTPDKIDNKIFIEQSKYGVDRVVPIPKGWKDEFIKKLPLQTTARTLQRKFKQYAEKAALNQKYTFHSLRHGFATRLLEAGVPINQVQLLLGHGNISTTNVYTRANPIDALRKYEELF